MPSLDIKTSGSLSISQHPEHICQWLWVSVSLKKFCPYLHSRWFNITRARSQPTKHCGASILLKLQYLASILLKLSIFHVMLVDYHRLYQLYPSKFWLVLSDKQICLHDFDNQLPEEGAACAPTDILHFSQPVVLIHRRRKFLIVANPTRVAYITRPGFSELVFVKVPFKTW